MAYSNYTQKAEKRAKLVMFREHLAELRDWYWEDDEDNRGTENLKSKQKSSGTSTLGT